MEKKPLVSIVMPNYNRGKYIGAAVESVLKQSIHDWELIIVDDASTDDSWTVISSFQDPRIRKIRLPENGHVSNAHNVGNALCEGQYIALLDSDDLWEKDKLEKQIEYLETHAETDLCFTLLKLVDSEGQPMRDENLEKLFQEKDRSREEWTGYLLKTGNHFANDSVLMRRKVMEETGWNDLSLIQLHDYDIWLRAVRKYNLHIIQEPLLLYRKGEETLSSKSASNRRRLLLESASIISRTVREMEDDFFLSVFREDLVRKDAAGTPMVYCEKALLLASDRLAVNCKAYAFEMFREILQDDEKRQVLRNQYKLDQHEIYRMTGMPILYDDYFVQKQEEKLQSLEHQNNILEAQLRNTEEKYSSVAGELERIVNTKTWRYLLPVRKLLSRIKRV